MTYEDYCALRDKYNLSDYAVSKLTGVSRATLSQWKKGNSKPSKANTERLSRYFEKFDDLKNNPLSDQERGVLFDEIRRLTFQNMINAEAKAYFLTLKDGTEIEITQEDYDELHRGIDAYIAAWCKMKNKI